MGFFGTASKLIQTSLRYDKELKNMNRRMLLITVLVFCLSTSLEAGQIYQWIGKDGVMHFTNQPPPPGVKIVNQQEAIPYDEAADQKNMQENQELMNQVLEQQQSQTDQQAASQPATSQQETPQVQTDSSSSENADEGVIVDPYVRNRMRYYERRRREREEIVTPLPSGDRMRQRIP
jgi:hypothetical protein